MENKAADLEVTIQELEEMESLKPPSRLHVARSPPESPREDQSSSSMIHLDILNRRSVQISLFVLIFLSLLYLTTLSSVKEDVGFVKSSVVIRELTTPLSPEYDSSLEAERKELAQELAREINAEIRKEVERQLNLRGAQRQRER